MKKVLILGASGLVGNALIKQLSNDFDVYGTYNTNNTLPEGKAYKLNVEDANSVSDILNDINPLMVISCLRGDFDSQLIIHEKVARYLIAKGGKLYFCSTANVFDNVINSPKYETDMVDASSDYGKFKIECENLLEGILDKENLCILRLPMIWGKDCIRLNNLREKLKHNEKVDIYTNLYMTNNYDVMLAKQIHYIMTNNLYGKFHLATKDVIRHDDFMLELITRLGYKKPKMKEHTLSEEKYFLAVVSNRTEIPDEYHIKNEDIINYLANNRG